MDETTFPSSVDATPTAGQRKPTEPQAAQPLPDEELAAETNAAADEEPAGDAQQHATELLRQWVQAHPLTAVAAALGLGLLIAGLAAR